jgi:Zn finger protein HypA/HybF involved in hydrogenase expression
MGIADWFKNRFGEQEEPEPVRGCDRCGFEYPETSMVIADDSLFCSECHDIRKKEVAEAEFRKKQAAVMQRIKYYCYECKFHFSRNKDFQLRLCPNCGSENFVA